MKKKDKFILIVGIVLIVLIIAGVILSVIKRKQKKKQIAEIRARIQAGIGASGQETADNILFKVKPDNKFNPVPDYKALLAADKWSSLDDDAAIYKVLGSRSKPQLKRLDEYMQQKNGKSLQKYLEGVFQELGDGYIWDTARGKYEKYDKAILMIKNAK